MKATDIGRAHELKRQLDGARALQRGLRGYPSLRFGDFRFVSGGSIGTCGDQPSFLLATEAEAADLLNKIEKRVALELTALGVSEP